MVADAGLTNLICFSGRRNGVTDLQGWENCEKGLKRLIPLAEKHKVVLTMELLNSVGHKDYLCDHTVWGAELCRRIGSPNFKLLYDIYHMQIMEGNIMRKSTRRRNFIIRLSSRLLWRQAIKASLGRSSSPPKKTRSLPWRSVSVSVMYRAI